jgi:mannose/cellobiose epimerase-like protein (N-acyl-D-glucosamine 2-epimerase family)
MKSYQGYLTLIGTVTSVDQDRVAFLLRCRSGDEFTVFVGRETAFATLRNLDELDRDRFPIPPGFQGGPADLLRQYVVQGHLIAAQGIYHEHEGEPPTFEARTISLLQGPDGTFYFEETHWWITQISRMADRWLDDFFGDKRTYEQDDFAALYRTNLNVMGLPTDDTIQECATLSRLIYGLASAYLLTGGERYLQAARAAVTYQRETFRSLSHDGRHCFWAYGRRRDRYGAKILVPSENPDDYGVIPLYEQIYALTGFCQYYRITCDWEVLDDIQRTVRTFNRYFLDRSGQRGYFSHLDYATLTPDVEALGKNRGRKNWNSIGDHIPAYLIDLILALEPLPAKQGGDIEEFLSECKWMLDETTDLIVTKFPDPTSPYVNERFFQDWTPDHEWGWQQTRAIIGHNLKIVWNLTRVANYYKYLAAQPAIPGSDGHAAARYDRKAAQIMAVAEKLGQDMVPHGLDLIRSGVFDAVERENVAGAGFNFVWGNTKDFWQQEQGILAYLILHGYTKNEEYLALARELSAFWNLYFLDHDNQGVFFRTNDNGTPIIQGNYGNKSGHSTGYHAPELNYLAHLYVRSYVVGKGEGEGNFCLFFKPGAGTGRSSINVLPDFYRPGTLAVKSVTVNGERRRTVDPDNFQIELSSEDLGCEVAVEFVPQT